MINTVFENGKALIAFITAGDPDLETTEKLLIAMSENGADVIEIGIPFSDPIAEGIVIQEADLRALNAGTTTDKIFDMVAKIRPQLKNSALAIMTYVNPIFVYGTEKFMAKCNEVGIQAVITPDVPFEEKEELSGYCDKYGVSLISMVAPTSKERIEMIAKEAQGFAYCFSPFDVAQSKDALAQRVNTIKAVSNIPCAVSSEISTPEQAKEASQIADGIIVGSEVVEIVAKYGKDSVDKVSEYIKEMKNAII